MHFTTRRHDVRRKALVVLHIARSEVGSPTLEFIEQFTWVFTQDINQNIESATVRHTDDNFLCPVATDSLYRLGHHGDQAFASFKSEALGTRILRGQ